MFKSNKIPPLLYLPVFLIISVIMLLSAAYIVPLPESISPPLSTVVRYSDGEIARVYIAGDEQWRVKREAKDVNELLINCVIEKEDRFFYYHPGVNPVSLCKAFYRMIKHRRIINGGSTITMQLARILEPKPRTFSGKFLEILRAIQYEIRFSKEEILGMYLNYAPFGGNIVGFETASMYYFGIPSDELDLAQAATLANLPQIPGVNLIENKELLKNKRDYLLSQMLQRNKIIKRDYEKAVSEKLKISRNRFPMEIPHIADRLHLSNSSNDYKTTIDRGLQRLAEEKFQDYRQKLNKKGITNASFVLIENDTGRVAAAAGSLDYFNSPQGQVRGYEGLRQPGSTLKPFLYGLAVDRGIITPRRKLVDTPLSYRDFEPHNFDQNYRGLVSAEEALAYSYNIPFVRLLKKTGKNTFLQFMKDGGIDSLRENSHYGLSVILGACDVSLIDLTNLYRVFANEGIYTDYRITEDEDYERPHRLLREGSCFLVSRALSLRNNPNIPHGFRNKPYVNRLRWKTGTSQDFKDAWTIGYGNEYTLGVWAGNFDARPNANLIGLEITAPIFFEILGNIEDKYDYSGSRVPEELIRIRVCPLSGGKATENCPETVDTFTFKDNGFTKRCDMHKTFLVEKESGLRVKNSFEGMGRLEKRVFTVLPRGVRNYLRDYFHITSPIPPYHSQSVKSASGANLKILSPRDGTVYYATSSGKLPLKVSSGINDGRVFWFLNGEFYRKMERPSMTFAGFPPGSHTLKAVNEDGSWDKINFHVLN